MAERVTEETMAVLSFIPCLGDCSQRSPCNNCADRELIKNTIDRQQKEIAALVGALQKLVNSCSTTHPDWGPALCEPDGNDMSHAIGVLKDLEESQR